MTIQYRSHVVAVVCGIILLAGATAQALAQTATNTAGIEGHVTDQIGATLPGATVTITSPALLRQLEAVTDENGRYRFTMLPGGVYTVTFSLSGFQQLIRQAVNVNHGFIATLDARLTVGAIEESITVSGESPLVDIRTTNASTSIKQEVMEAIPTSRAYADMVKLAPGVRLSGLPDIGGSETGGQRTNMVSYGSNAGGVTFMIDGVNTDGTGGYFDFGAIEEVVVRSGGNDAEIATPGLAFQLVTKSGGNDFRGDFLAAWQGESMQSDNVTDELRQQGISSGDPMDHYYDFNASVGGRIVRDRLWFFGSVRRKEYARLPLGFADEPGSDATWFTGDDVQGILTDSERNVATRFSGAPGIKHKVSFMYQYGNKGVDNQRASIYVPHESAVVYRLPVHTWKGEWTSTPTDRSIISGSIGNSQYHSWGQPYSDKPTTYDTVTLRYGGAAVNAVGTGADAGYAGSLSARLQYEGSYTYFLPNRLGEHEFKIGAYFANEQYNREQFLRDEGHGGLGQDYQLFFSNFQPVEILLFNSPFASENNVDYQSAFVRDVWRATNRLTLNLGLRLERYHTFLPAQSKPAGPYSLAAEYPYRDMYDWRALAPRAGVSYALASDNRTVVKATIGMFNHAIRPSNTQILRNLNGNEYEAWRYRWSDPAQRCTRADTQMQCQGGPISQSELGALVRIEGGSTTRGIHNPDLEQPLGTEYTVRFEHEISSVLSVQTGYIYKSHGGLHQLVNTARPYEAYNIPISTRDPGPDGVAGNADDGSMVTYYDYDPAYRGPEFEYPVTMNRPSGFDDTYQNIEFGFNKRLSSGWQAMASFLATKNDVWINGQPQTPNDEAFFPKDETWVRTFRAAGSYTAPWSIQTSAMFEYQTGAKQARDVLFRTGLQQLASLTLRMEPLGSQALPSYKLLSFRASKTFNFATSQRATVQFDLYNALNASDATGITFRSGPNYGRITGILPPRVARIGMTYAF